MSFIAKEEVYSPLSAYILHDYSYGAMGLTTLIPFRGTIYISSFRTFVNLTRLSVTILCSYTIIVCWRAPLAIQHIQAYTNQGPSNYNSRYVCVHANGSLLVASIESVVALL